MARRGRYGRQVFLNVPFDSRYKKLLHALVFAVHDLGLTARSAQEKEDGGQVRIGARHYDRRRQPRKACLVLERDRYRYHVFCSDIAGQDIRDHGNEVDKAISAVRARTLQLRYFRFRRDLPYMCRDQGTTVPQLTFLDYRLNVHAWIAENPVPGS